MLIYSMSVSVDGFIADREGAFGWTVPSDELFRFHLAQVRELGGVGRRPASASHGAADLFHQLAAAGRAEETAHGGPTTHGA